MDYYIHASHEGYGDQENQPHVHVCFGSKSDKSTQVSVSLLTCSAIAVGGDLRYSHQKAAEEFVKDNLSRLKSEWDSKSGSHW